ncbi:sigma factor-like helix-turn-helix DNA-binding protein [Desulfosporosinus sp.]|uniref:sigma factor-like helix-turn-helix DNA-binding protein n=1 Tax=Desulfosporosinus sp. TaxID=157907 RepID=UPI00341B7626
MTERERLVIQLRFGLINGPEKTHKEIAKILGISKSYVSRIEKSATKKLINEMGDSNT